jgi:hypothetical protein
MPCCFALFCLENGSNGCVFKVLNIMYHVCIIDLASIIYGKVEYGRVNTFQQIHAVRGAFCMYA